MMDGGPAGWDEGTRRGSLKSVSPPQWPRLVDDADDDLEDDDGLPVRGATVKRKVGFRSPSSAAPDDVNDDAERDAAYSPPRPPPSVPPKKGVKKGIRRNDKNRGKSMKDLGLPPPPFEPPPSFGRPDTILFDIGGGGGEGNADDSNDLPPPPPPVPPKKGIRRNDKNRGKSMKDLGLPPPPFEPPPSFGRPDTILFDIGGGDDEGNADDSNDFMVPNDDEDGDVVDGGGVDQATAEFVFDRASRSIRLRRPPAGQARTTTGDEAEGVATHEQWSVPAPQSGQPNNQHGDATDVGVDPDDGVVHEEVEHHHPPDPVDREGEYLDAEPAAPAAPAATGKTASDRKSMMFVESLLGLERRGSFA